MGGLDGFFGNVDHLPAVQHRPVLRHEEAGLLLRKEIVVASPMAALRSMPSASSSALFQRTNRRSLGVLDEEHDRQVLEHRVQEIPGVLELGRAPRQRFLRPLVARSALLPIERWGGPARFGPCALPFFSMTPRRAQGPCSRRTASGNETLVRISFVPGGLPWGNRSMSFARGRCRAPVQATSPQGRALCFAHVDARAIRASEGGMHLVHLHAARERVDQPSDGLPAVAHAPVGKRERRLAEREGFEPPCRLPGKTLSRRPRYDHFGTSPFCFDRGPYQPPSSCHAR